MRVIKPYGRSATETVEDGSLRRRLRPQDRSAAPDGSRPPADIAAFAGRWPEVVIAQWISAIDKIATKPKGDSGASDGQRALRNTLGHACWGLLTGAGGALAGLAPERLARLRKHWDRKLHPYGDRKWKPRKRKDGSSSEPPDPRAH